jgi:hypothetical protein
MALAKLVSGRNNHTVIYRCGEIFRPASFTVSALERVYATNLPPSLQVANKGIGWDGSRCGKKAVAACFVIKAILLPQNLS